MASIDCNILQLYFPKDYTFAFVNNHYDAKINIIEVDVEKALLLALKEYKKIQFKAIVFIHDYHTLETQPFRIKCQQLCKEYGYYCYFTSMYELGFSATLFDNQIMVKPGENILHCFISINQASCMVFTRDANAYHYKDAIAMEYSSKTVQDVPSFSKSIAEKNNAKKVIYVVHKTQVIPKTKHGEELAALFKKELSGFDLLMLELFDTARSVFNVSYIKVLDAMGVKKNSYLVDPTFSCNFTLSHNTKCLIKEEYLTSLPYEKSITFKVNSKNDYVELKEYGKNVIERKLLTNFVNKEVKITMKIDINYIYSISIAPAEVEKVAEVFDKTLKLDVDHKAKIVLTPHNYSILIPKDGKMCHLKVDGKEKVPLYISFMDEKPIIGEAAKKMLQENPSFVVYDIIKLCSITDPKNVDPKWKFIVKLDKEQKILIEFETDEGKKQFTPEFLLALIFRDCKSRIKKEAGQKINEINIEIRGIKRETHLLEKIKEAASRVNIETNIVFN